MIGILHAEIQRANITCVASNDKHLFYIKKGNCYLGSKGSDIRWGYNLKYIVCCGNGLAGITHSGLCVYYGSAMKYQVVANDAIHVEAGPDYLLILDQKSQLWLWTGIYSARKVATHVDKMLPATDSFYYTSNECLYHSNLKHERLKIRINVADISRFGNHMLIYTFNVGKMDSMEEVEWVSLGLVEESNINHWINRSNGYITSYQARLHGYKYFINGHAELIHIKSGKIRAKRVLASTANGKRYVTIG